MNILFYSDTNSGELLAATYQTFTGVIGNKTFNDIYDHKTLVPGSHHYRINMMSSSNGMICYYKP